MTWPVALPPGQGSPPQRRFTLEHAAQLLAVPTLKGQISVRDVGCRYHESDRPVLSDISLEIPAGSTVALVGRSGCGKSTTGRLLLNLIPPTSGEVLFDGQPISRMRGKRLSRMRRRFQIVFQDPYASLNPRLPVLDILGEPLLMGAIAQAMAAM